MEYTTIGESCSVVSGGTPSRSKTEYWRNGTIPWIKIGNIKSKYVNEYDELITEQGLNNSSAKLLKKGTILYTIFATLGEVGILDTEACTNQAIAGISINDPRITTDYLYYYLKSKKDYVNNIGRGVAQNNINLTTLKKFEIPLINVDKQLYIVEVLEKVERLIGLKKKEIDDLDFFIKARFVEMFGDPKKNNKNLVSIGSIGHLNSGGTPSRGKPEYFQGNIKWFTAGELNSLYLGDTIEHISEDGLKNSSAKLFKKGTLMIGMYDTAAFKMGILTEDSASNQACANLEPNDNYDVIWLYYVFSILKPLYLNERQGVRQQNLSLTKIKNLQFPAAPFDKQKKFADFVREVDKSKFRDFIPHKYDKYHQFYWWYYFYIFLFGLI